MPDTGAWLFGNLGGFHAHHRCVVVENLFLSRKLSRSHSLPLRLPIKLQGKFTEADALHVQALEGLCATVGEEHSDYASALSNRASTLASRVGTLHIFPGCRCSRAQHLGGAVEYSVPPSSRTLKGLKFRDVA